MRRLTALAIVCAFLSAPPAFASERHPTLSEVEHEVMCPTCKTLLVLSHAPIADRMRAFIRARIAAGETKSRIESRLVSEFGEQVLAAPPTSGFGLLAWLLPVVGLLGGGLVVAAVGWRWTRGDDAGLVSGEPSQNGRVSPEPALERRLDRELASFE